MPLNIMQLAARMDEALDEQGKSTYVSEERGVVIEGEFGAVEPDPLDDLTKRVAKRVKELKAAA